jgi:hypothetical protein
MASIEPDVFKWFEFLPFKVKVMALILSILFQAFGK